MNKYGPYIQTGYKPTGQLLLSLFKDHKVIIKKVNFSVTNFGPECKIK